MIFFGKSFLRSETFGFAWADPR